ncbi:MAG: hypothetical protein ACK5QQ_06005 [Cyanobacteriota bacterium]|jgi:hypothetical protein
MSPDALTVSADQPSFQKAFELLLSRAPGPVFPRARQLYLRKYPLETDPATPFRTFLLEESIQESEGGIVRIRALRFAVVQGDGQPFDLAACRTYLHQRWGLEPDELVPMGGDGWFRDGGAWARFTAAAVHERAAPTTLISRPDGPDVPAASGDPSR